MQVSSTPMGLCLSSLLTESPLSILSRDNLLKKQKNKKNQVIHIIFIQSQVNAFKEKSNHTHTKGMVTMASPHD